METREDLIKFIVEYKERVLLMAVDEIQTVEMSIDELKANVESIKQYKIDLRHNDLREILMKYNCPEYGDCIVDEICNLFDFPMTNEES
jgi:hypothetical protein